MYVMEHPAGIVLFDTGMSHGGLGSPHEYWGETVDGLDLARDGKGLHGRQACLPGVESKDVRYVVMSHLHFDHAGEMESFPEATSIVPRLRDEVRVVG